MPTQNPLQRAVDRQALWYVRPAVSGARQILRASAFMAATATAFIGCGGGERQDADEPRAGQRLEVVSARFADRQRLGARETLAITVRNPGSEEVDGAAVTVRGFSARSARTDQSDPGQPVWIVDSAPAGDETAYDGTWTTGALAPGARRTLRWRLTPVVTGTHKVAYTVAVGLDEGAGEGSRERRPRGTLTARVSGRPARARVDPRTGRVVREGDSGGSAPSGY